MSSKAIQNAVLGYVGQESSQERLPSGKHVVKCVEHRVLHSRIQWDGSPKDNLPAFSDTTPQLSIMFRNEDGVGWHRFNIFGYRRWDELTDKQRESDQYEAVTFGQTTYACKVKANGKFERIRCEKRTKDAQSFLDQFLASVGHTGSTVGDAMEDITAKGTEFTVVLEDDEYDGKDQVRVKNFAKAVTAAEVEEEFGS